MFTGIIQKVGTVKSVRELGSGSARAMDLEVSNPFDGVQLGESIAHNGVCLTVTEIKPDSLVYNLAPETLARTALGHLRMGSKVNLERALQVGDRLSGHWVQGHVDGVAKTLSIGLTPVDGGRASAPEYFDWKVEVLDASLAQYFVKKGSVAVDGISLTIHEISSHDGHAVLEFQIVPHTWNHTHLVGIKGGDLVNIEVDLFAKYVAKFASPYLNKL